MVRNDRLSLLREFVKTMRSFLGALVDWTLLRVPPLRGFINFFRKDEFAFLVHPRTDEFITEDVYGGNDIYRPYPAFRLLYRLLPEKVATGFITWYAQMVVPITLSRISLRRINGEVIYGSLLSTVRTPRMLVGAGKNKERLAHLQDLYALAAAKGVKRIGLGALLPSMTGYGKKLTAHEGFPSRSTGHAYTGYVITKYLLALVQAREASGDTVRVAVVGAAGSTGTATLRVLKRLWQPAKHPIELFLVDLPAKEKSLELLAAEMRSIGLVDAVYDHTVLRECDYIIVVTNGENAKIKVDFVSRGCVIIDDSQPRNTSRELLESGCHMVDVLARVPGLNCNFDFGFRTSDSSVTFTCLAETVIAAALGIEGDLALGTVDDLTIERVIKIVEAADDQGLIGDLPYFSFGHELTKSERTRLLTRQRKLAHTTRPAAE